MASSRQNWQLAKRLTVHIGIVALALLFLFPFYWLFISAFKTRSDIFNPVPEFWPSPWSMQGFTDVFQKIHIFRAFINSTIIATGHCILALFLCSLGGFAFAKYPNAPGRNKLFAFVLATMMIPSAVTIIPVFIVLCKLHAVNTYWAMIIPGAASAFGIFWIRQYTTENLHNDLLDAARIDGCGEFALYWRVALPVLKPAMAALSIVLLLNIWNNLMWAFIVLRTEDKYTLPLVIYLLKSENRTPFELIMAASLIAALPLVFCFLLFQRQFVQGITAGAIKG